MARLLHAGIEDASPCAYLPAQTAGLEHRVMLDVSPEEADELFDRGWRHFGLDWFRPACSACDQCLPTRVPVERFVPNRSQRRVLRHLGDLRSEVGDPIVDEARLALFSSWHRERESARGWHPSPIDGDSYFMQFAFPTEISREVAYYDRAAGDRLVMVAICDETPRIWSAVFCFYDPSYAHLSPGVLNILNLVALARTTRRRFLHLGYRVAACPSLSYKGAFRPQEYLSGRPADGEEAHWVSNQP